MKKPNLFILGAPKCGTTSMACWLADHPRTYFSRAKEPNTFCFDVGERSYRTLEMYESLFENAEKRHLIVGEASPLYLFSRTAVPAILEYADNPRFIVMIRNPTDMAYSLYEQMVFNGEEDETSFERAWALQDFRVYSGRIPKSCSDPQLLLYGRLCRLGEQLKRLYDLAPREQVLVINLEDVRANAQREYRRVLKFLGLEDNGRTDFPVLNAAKERRFPLLWKCMRSINRTLIAAGIPHIRLGLTAFLSERDRRERPRPPMSVAMRKRLCTYFLDDIALLEGLTGWDLTSWKFRNNSASE